MGLFSRNRQNSTYSLPSDDFFNQLRKTEFGRLNTLGQTYLDYTGGNLHPKSLLEKHYKLLQESILGNPHSTNPSSQMSTQLVEEARQKIIDFFNAEDYYCIFTSNASGALKIVGECYPFEDNGHYLMTSDNHNSVNGIREYCKSKGGDYTYSPIRQEDLRIDEEHLNKHLDSFTDKKNKLLSFYFTFFAFDIHHIIGQQPSRNQLVGLLLTELLIAMPRFAKEGFQSFREDWNALDLAKGKSVSLYTEAETFTGIARGVTEQGEFLLDMAGELKAFQSGDISLRLNKKEL